MYTIIVTMDWNVDGWEYIAYGSGGYSRLFVKGDRVRKLCIIGRRDPDEAENYIVQTDWGPTGFSSYKLDGMRMISCIPKEKVDREVKLQREIACACSDHHHKSVAPLVYASKYFEQVDPRTLGFNVYYLKEGEHKGFLPVEGSKNVYKELHRADLYLIEMERINNPLKGMNAFQNKRTFANFDTSLKLYARSLVLFLADMGYLHNDYHLQNFMLDATITKSVPTNIKCYVIDYGNTRRLTPLELQEYISLQSVQEKVMFIHRLSPSTFKKSERNIYKWFWQKEPDDVDTINVDDSDCIPLENVLEHLPMTNCVKTYSKNDDLICKGFEVVKV